MAIIIMISKDMNIKEVTDKYPEVSAVLSKAGLHCVGCHVSAEETIAQGCSAHGMSEKEIDGLIVDANNKIKLFDTMPGFKFTQKAIDQLKQKMAGAKAKYIRLLPIFGGFDFDAVKEKYETEILIDSQVPIVTSPNLERFLRGVTIDYDAEQKDFTAKRSK
jgi:hybrid cluster-associated redox disulfide protein